LFAGKPGVIAGLSFFNRTLVPRLVRDSASLFHLACPSSSRRILAHSVAIPTSYARIQNQNSYLHQGGAMIERNITLPEMILWTGTRVALGVGIGMLVSRRLGKDAMKSTGLALTFVGAFTTIPLAIAIMGKKNLTRPEIRSVA
jgi:hypothetical protein